MLQRFEGMLGMALVRELDAKIIHNENKDDWPPLVLPKTRCSVALVVPVFVQPLHVEVIGKFARLLDAIDSFCDFKVNPAMMCKGHDVIFLDEFLWDDGELGANIFWLVKGHTKVEV